MCVVVVEVSMHMLCGFFGSRGWGWWCEDMLPHVDEVEKSNDEEDEVGHHDEVDEPIFGEWASLI